MVYRYSYGNLIREPELDTYAEQSLKAKRVREGIREQREVVRGKKKKVSKPWTVYTSCWGPRLGHCDFYTYRFSSEDDATRYAEKLRRTREAWRNTVYRAGSEWVWVVDNTELR